MATKKIGRTLLNGVNSTVEGEKVNVSGIDQKTVGVFIGGTATVKIYGYVKGIKAQIGSDITASGHYEISAVLDSISASVTAYTSGAITVELIGG